MTELANPRRLAFEAIAAALTPPPSINYLRFACDMSSLMAPSPVPITGRTSLFSIKS
jgi:hypothetical protein